MNKIVYKILLKYFNYRVIIFIIIINKTINECSCKKYTHVIVFISGYIAFRLYLNITYILIYSYKSHLNESILTTTYYIIYLYSYRYIKQITQRKLFL